MEKLTYTHTYATSDWEALYLPFTVSLADLGSDYDVAQINNVHEYDTDGTDPCIVLETFAVKGAVLKLYTPYLIRRKTPAEAVMTLSDVTMKKLPLENTFSCRSTSTVFSFTGTMQQLDGNGTADRTVLEARRMTGGVLTANTPYLVRSQNTGSVTIDLRDVQHLKVAPDSIDCGSMTLSLVFRGTYDAMTPQQLTAANAYVASDGMLSRPSTALKPFRWYVRMEGEETEHPAVHDYSLTEDGISYDILSESDRTVAVMAYAHNAETDVWRNFITAAAATPLCAVPSATIANGTLLFSCDTPGAQYHYSVSPLQGFALSGSTAQQSLSLRPQYIVSLYATASGYDASEKVTLVLSDTSLNRFDVNADGKVTMSDANAVVNAFVNGTE